MPGKNDSLKRIGLDDTVNSSMKYARRQEKKKQQTSQNEQSVSKTETTSAAMTSNVSGIIKPERDASGDSISKRRVSKHPAAKKQFVERAQRRRSVHRHMSRRQGEITFTINTLDAIKAHEMLQARGESSILQEAKVLLLTQYVGKVPEIDERALDEALQLRHNEKVKTLEDEALEQQEKHENAMEEI